MRATEFIIEALKPSEYRQYVKSWDKARFASLFNDPKFNTDRNHYRIYLPLVKSPIQVANVPVEIQNTLSEKGYEVQDYKAGLAKEKNGKRIMKIGKLLPPDLQQKFANDKSRQAQDEYMVVISRHPYDIAGMSTDRGWVSCMNLRDGINRHYVAVDVKEGTIIAYLVKTTDIDIKNPVGRISIKPFIELNTREIVFGAEDRVYGTDVPGFKKTVINWVNYTNKKIITKDMILAQLAPGIYPDSNKISKPKVLTKDPNIKTVIKNPKAILDIETPSEEVQLAAISQDGNMIRYIIDSIGGNPSEKVQLVAVEENGSAIRYIKNPSERVQLAAVKNDGHALRYIIAAIGGLPSEEVQLAAVKKSPYMIEDIIAVISGNPSEQVQLAAVMNNGLAIQDIVNPSERVQLAAVKNNGAAIRFIINAIGRVPSEQVQLAAVKERGHALRYIIADIGGLPSEEVQLAAVKKSPYIIEDIIAVISGNPSEQVQLAAVMNNGYAIRFIKNPSEKIQLAAVDQNAGAIIFIEKPSDRVKLAAKKENSNG